MVDELLGQNNKASATTEPFDGRLLAAAECM